MIKKTSCIIQAFLFAVMFASVSLADAVLPEDWGNYSVSGDRFVINGTITRLTLAGLKLNEKNIKVVELNSNGGHTDAGYAIAQVIRENNMDTFVGSGRRCYSTCPVIFQAGKNRIAGESAMFMYHTVTVSAVVMTSVRMTDTSFEKEERKETRKLIDYLRTHGVSEVLLKKIAVGHNEYISSRKAYKVNVVTVINDSIKPLAGILKFDWSDIPTDAEIVSISKQYGLDFLINPFAEN